MHWTIVFTFNILLTGFKKLSNIMFSMYFEFPQFKIIQIQFALKALDFNEYEKFIFCDINVQNI